MMSRAACARGIQVNRFSLAGGCRQLRGVVFTVRYGTSTTFPMFFRDSM